MARILLLEDDASFADLVVASLALDSHVVEVCDTVAEALERLKSVKFDIIVADVFIRVGNRYSQNGGISLISKVKQVDAKKIPIIAISGSFTQSEPSHIKDSLRTVGANAVLGKPFHPEELLNLIAELTLSGPR